MENRVHYVRGVAFCEGARRTLAGAAPLVLGCVTGIVRHALAAAEWKSLESGRGTHTDPGKNFKFHGITGDRDVES